MLLCLLQIKSGIHYPNIPLQLNIDFQWKVGCWVKSLINSSRKFLFRPKCCFKWSLSVKNFLLIIVILLLMAFPICQIYLEMWCHLNPLFITALLICKVEASVTCPFALILDVQCCQLFQLMILKMCQQKVLSDNFKPLQMQCWLWLLVWHDGRCMATMAIQFSFEYQVTTFCHQVNNCFLLRILHVIINGNNWIWIAMEVIYTFLDETCFW